MYVTRLDGVCNMTRWCVQHDSMLYATWLTRFCDMSHSYKWNLSCIRVTWLVHVCNDSFVRVTWLVHVCDMTHLYMQHNSLVCARLTHFGDMFHLCVWDFSRVCATWLIYVCDMTHPCVWHDSFSCVSCHTYEWVMAHMLMIHGTHMNESWHSLVCATWLILVGATCHTFKWVTAHT